MGHAPTHSAMPNVTITKPRYIGFRVNPKGPDVMSFRFVAEVGFSSVPSRRKSTAEETDNAIPSPMSAMASGTNGKPVTSGHPAK